MRARGFSILELHVTLLLSVLLFIGALSAVRGLTEGKATLSRLMNEQRLALRARDLLERAMIGMDSHRLPLPPRVHRDGMIRSLHGAPLLPATGTSAAAPESDAITFLELAAPERLHSLGDGTYRRCGPPLVMQCGVLVTPEGLSEVTLEPVGRMHGGCQTFRFSLSDSMSVAPAESAPRHARLLLPMREHATVYISAEGTLRVARHCALRIIEQQPIADGAEALKLDLQPRAQGTLWELSAVLVSATQRHFSFHLAHRLARAPSLVTLLMPWEELRR